MMIDDLDWIRGKNERRLEELESRLAEQRKLRAAMSAELRRVQEALDKEYGAQSPRTRRESTGEISRWFMTNPYPATPRPVSTPPRTM